jgi:hypothetical protein
MGKAATLPILQIFQCFKWDARSPHSGFPSSLIRRDRTCSAVRSN